MATFRKMRDGKWVVFALESECADEVTVTLKNGNTKQVSIERWSRPFDTENGAACYGTPLEDGQERKPAPAKSAPAAAPRVAPEPPPDYLDDDDPF